VATPAPPPPDVLSSEHIADPWPGLAILRDHYPVFFDEQTGCWLISRYDTVRELNRLLGPGESFQELLGQYLADFRAFTAMDGADHRRRRTLLAPFFSRGGVEGYGASIEEVARGLLEPIFERERKAVAAGERERGEMDFIKEFTLGFTVTVMANMLGIEIDDQARLEEWFEAWIAAEGNIGRDPEIIARALRTKQDFGEFIMPLIAERRRDGRGEDLLSRLCRAEIEGFSLCDEEIRSIVAGMLLGGGETTDHQLGWLLYELIKQPDVQDALAADRGLMDAVLGEGMRHCAIVQYFGLMTSEEMEVEGVRIGKDSPLALVLAAANHDPRRFENPDEFDIYRQDHDSSKAFNGSAEHMGFGTGAHFCIGSHLSKAEQQIALELLLDNVRDIRLAEGFEPRANPEAVFVRALPSLKISFELR